MNPKNPYHSKHGARLAAEFVAIALAVWDRQHGQASVAWDQLSEHEKKQAEARALKIREEGYPEPKDEREEFEHLMFSACFEEAEDLEDERTVKEVENGNKEPTGGPLPGSSDVNVQPDQGTPPKVQEVQQPIKPGNIIK